MAGTSGPCPQPITNASGVYLVKHLEQRYCSASLGVWLGRVVVWSTIQSGTDGPS